VSLETGPEHRTSPWELAAELSAIPPDALELLRVLGYAAEDPE
jgi:hypothetical protein